MVKHTRVRLNRTKQGRCESTLKEQEHWLLQFELFKGVLLILISMQIVLVLYVEDSKYLAETAEN